MITDVIAPPHGWGALDLAPKDQTCVILYADLANGGALAAQVDWWNPDKQAWDGQDESWKPIGFHPLPNY